MKDAVHPLERRPGMQGLWNLGHVGRVKGYDNRCQPPRSRLTYFQIAPVCVVSCWIHRRRSFTCAPKHDQGTNKNPHRGFHRHWLLTYCNGIPQTYLYSPFVESAIHILSLKAHTRTDWGIRRGPTNQDPRVAWLSRIGFETALSHRPGSVRRSVFLSSGRTLF
jgi:hypothetical protein